MPGKRRSNSVIYGDGFPPATGIGRVNVPVMTPCTAVQLPLCELDRMLVDRRVGREHELLLEIGKMCLEAGGSATVWAARSLAWPFTRDRQLEAARVGHFELTRLHLGVVRFAV